ncbi:STAS/SEC14 domain-containing protein [Oceanicola sp. S124]|uniref:STAS/SEC14 domain-containing protein n=1 Tax=Oceanicola sp. S124 TaxID=1042378 RepID=UPI000255A1C4|nr:STAS/SEC14 domain-containing protein [Oceanicola sp. S124]
MFKETLTERDDVIGLVCEGKLTETEFKQMHALLHERLGTTDNPGLVLDLTRFDGYEEPSAMLEDLKIDTAHANDFGRIAVVGERRWMEWGARVVNLLTRSEMQWFESSDTESAIARARDG